MASKMGLGGYWALWFYASRKEGEGKRVESLQDGIQLVKSAATSGGCGIVITQRDSGPYILLRKFGEFPPGATITKTPEGDPVDLEMKTTDGQPVRFKQVDLPSRRDRRQRV